MKSCFSQLGSGGFLLLMMMQTAEAGACLSPPVNISPNLVTSVFGKTRDLPQYNGVPHVHWGTDLQARSPSNPSVGADLVAADDGVVIGAGFWGSGYGNRVALQRANGDIVLYNHLASIEPKLKSGGSVGFANGAAGVGTVAVAAGDKVGVAGGTSSHMDQNGLPIHLHLEYVTGYGGTKLRETNDGTDATRSRYMRDPLLYMCKSIAHTATAGPVAPGEGAGGSAGANIPSAGAATANQNVPNSDAQVADAKETQPTVQPSERYGVPDSPPYETYDGMSESQIIDAEFLRRTLDTDWAVKLTGWSKRGLWVEIARMRGAKLWLQDRIEEKKRRVELLAASTLAFRTNAYFTPRLRDQYSRAMRSADSKKVQ